MAKGEANLVAAVFFAFIRGIYCDALYCSGKGSHEKKTRRPLRRFCLSIRRGGVWRRSRSEVEEGAAEEAEEAKQEEREAQEEEREAEEELKEAEQAAEEEEQQEEELKK